MKATYYLISTSNSRLNGWTVYGCGTKEEMKQAQLTEPAFQGTDIYADTLNKNSVVVSKTTAIRKYGLKDL